MKAIDLTNKKLTIALVVQLVLVIVLWWPKSSASLGRKHLFEKVDFSKLSQIEIGEKVTGDQKVDLKKINGTWVVSQEADYPADQKRLDDFLNKIEKLNPGYPLVENTSSHERMEVSEDKYQRKISFFSEGNKDDKAKEGFYIGTSPQFRKVYLRRLNEKQVYASAALNVNEIPAQPQEWLQKKLINADSDDILAIEIKRGHDAMKLERREVDAEKPAKKDKDGKGKDEKSAAQPPAKEKAWFVSENGKAEHRVDKSKFDHILRNLANLSITKVLGKEAKPEYGLDKPQVEIQLTLKGSGDKPIEKTILVGKTNESEDTLQVKDSPYYVTAAANQLKDLLEKKGADLAKN